MIRTALAGAIAALALAAGAAGAATTEVSSNWAGYVATGASFTAVSGTWVQPTASCTVGETSSSAFWVGLGGSSDTSTTLEQAGTTAECTATGTTRYWAWYELVPEAAVKVALKVRAGDTISASVKVNGTTVTMRVRNVTRKTVVTKVRRMAAPDTSSAEWIAEAPSLCADSGACRTVSLTNFGVVRFTKAGTTGNGHTGTISDRAWTATAIELSSAASAGRSFGPYVPFDASGEAVPTALSAGGSAFSVKWRESETVQTQPDPGGP
jgi:hypothetical protein